MGKISPTGDIDYELRRKKKKPKMVSGWYYDNTNDMSVRWLTFKAGASNNGEYHYTSFVGPYKTFEGARRAALPEIECRYNMALRELKTFLTMKKPKKKGSRS
jgi:hypothetical protein